ncbi:PilZ domain protein [Mariprofundus micogutta]|uniref:PilZ domain protein n=1 Tax=Mariprofundus micogutta TaxID=1921010 RepID=A0A1L8CNS8_9PROT|nr:PilZ domain-containing protein [Mariprofundus micogutta]GAV20558.1 PilZ domain protein [Mariprofundus micogutta]
MTIRAKMLKDIIQNLEHELPAVQSSTTQMVARVILGEEVERSMGSLAVSLLQSNVSVGHILSALLRCEWLSVQHLIETTDTGNIKKQVRLFSESVEHFNILQAAIIDAADQRWQGALDEEVKQRVLAELKLNWQQTGTVRLHNYFDEIPVAAKVEFRGFDKKKYLWVSQNKDLITMFAASAGSNTALISSLDRAHNLMVCGVNKFEDKICLEITGAEVSLRERRKDVRVKLARALPISLNHRGEVIHANIIDLSCTGLGLKLIDENAALLHNEKLSCAFKLGSELMKCGEAIVCWAKEVDSEYRLGIRFKPATIKRETIYRFIFVQEQAIIGRLKQLEMPSWMKDPIELCDADE